MNNSERQVDEVKEEVVEQPGRLGKLGQFYGKTRLRMRDWIEEQIAKNIDAGRGCECRVGHDEQLDLISWMDETQRKIDKIRRSVEGVAEVPLKFQRKLGRLEKVKTRLQEDEDKNDARTARIRALVAARSWMKGELGQLDDEEFRI